jgi:hypothetical protein
VDDPGVTEPAAVGEPASAVTQPIPVVTTEQCAQCGAPLAHDQRYCLHCGEPRPHVRGPLSSKLAVSEPPQALATPNASSSAPPGSTPPGFAPPGSSPPPAGIPGASPSARNNSLALIAGVGVLLLAMGVGVLIGRAGAPAAKVPPAQVISLGAGTGAGATTTPTTTTPETTTPSSTTKKPAKAKEPAGTGSSITKPAPPSAAKNLRSGGSGQSYEQKSKNLPNVVSTG